jgi:hypothetical protein
VVAIREENEVFQQPQKCGGAKTHKGRSPRLGFCGTRSAEQALSIYRLLCEVGFCFYSFVFNIFI